jgi:hypothetical protein
LGVEAFEKIHYCLSFALWGTGRREEGGLVWAQVWRAGWP